MPQAENKKLALPNPLSTYTTEVEIAGSVVIVGANGAGKSRLGAWIEFDSPQRERVHRVAAQKSLSMPASTSPKSIDLAESDLLYGYPEARKAGDPGIYKRGHRWGDNPCIFLLNDFDRLMVYLFSDHFDKSSEYLESSRRTNRRIEPPDTRLDTIKCIWEDTLPYRQLIIGGGRVQTCVKDQPAAAYNAAEMSDGERVIFYLIGQCLAAPQDGIIVIDEPELHLHRSIQMNLWNRIEAERPDCLFVYLTHDLDFAATRRNATKMWLKSFDGTVWDWHLVPEREEIPEEVLLNILGSRKPVVFIEGNKDSLDHFLFSHLYPEHTVVSCGGCSQAIAAARSFRSLKNLHSLECYAIIDRDFRPPAEIEHLEQKGVYVLNFSEVENLLLAEQVVREIAIAELVPDVDRCIEAVKRTVLDEMQEQRERIISSLVASEVALLLSRFDEKVEGLGNLQNSLETTFREANVRELYEGKAAEVDAIIKLSDYPGALRLFNHKGLVHKIAPHLGRNGQQYTSFVKRLLSSKRGASLRDEMRQHVPILPSPTSSPFRA